MKASYRLRTNNCKEEFDLGYVFDIQHGVEIDGKMVWTPYIACKTLEDARAVLKECQNSNV